MPKVTGAPARRRAATAPRGSSSVDDAGRVGGKHLEEPALGREVRLHVLVEVEVVARQVGEDRRPRTACRRRASAPARATTLPSPPTGSPARSSRQQLLHVGRFGRRARRLALLAAEAVGHRARAGPPSGRRRRASRQQVAVVVLPLVPVTPTTGMRRLGMVVEAIGQQRQRQARVADHEPRRRDAFGRGASATMTAAPRAIACGTNAAPSAFRPRSATNTAPARHAARVVGDRRHRPSGRLRRASVGSPVASPRARRARRRRSLAGAPGHQRESRRIAVEHQRAGRRRARAARPAPASARRPRPCPAAAAVRPSRASVRSASRALKPRRSGSTDARRAPGGQRHDRGDGRPSTAASTGALVAAATTTGGAGLMVGGTPRWRSAASAMRLKIGAATTPPVSAPTRGVSIITMTVSAGLRDGTKPTNDTFCCVPSSGR